jgi:lysozyme
MIDETIEKIKKHEGFRGETYNDHLGNPTIGYGTLLPLSKAEATMLIRHRLLRMQKELFETSEVYRQVGSPIKSILDNMAYQMGVKGLLKFKKTLAHIANHDYILASAEMLNSKWAEQTPNRALELSEMMASIKD